jgi:hypothetical protein
MLKNILKLNGAQQLSKKELQTIKGAGPIKSCLNGAICRTGLQCCLVNGSFRCVVPSGNNCFVIDGN